MRQPANLFETLATLAGVSTPPSLDGRDMDLLTLGSGPRKIWLIGRQHPGETMASWFFEGFLERLLDASDSASQKLLRDATLYLVPNMNPDGSYRGHLRTNAVAVAKP